jgi:hypothetical protein
MGGWEDGRMREWEDGKTREGDGKIERGIE